jgi:hypothetical protein
MAVPRILQACAMETVLQHGGVRNSCFHSCVQGRVQTTTTKLVQTTTTKLAKRLSKLIRPPHAALISMQTMTLHVCMTTQKAEEDSIVSNGSWDAPLGSSHPWASNEVENYTPSVATTILECPPSPFCTRQRIMAANTHAHCTLPSEQPSYMGSRQQIMDANTHAHCCKRTTRRSSGKHA